MGVQCYMTIGDKKGSSAFPIASGGGAYPTTEEVGIISILPAADLHRLGEVQRTVMYCLEYARDNNIFISAGSIAIVTTLDAGKSGIREEGIIANVVTDEVGIMVVGSTRVDGGTLITYEAHRQLLDWMNENDRLVS